MTKAQPLLSFYAYISGAWVQLNDTSPSSGSWGMPDNDAETRMADIGEMTLALDNSTGIYSPDGTSALAGWGKGIPFKFVVNYEGEDRIRFFGAIDDIRLPSTPGDIKVYITIVDWLDYATKYPIVNPSLLENSTADDAIDVILAALPNSPQAQSISTGNYTFPTLFDTVRDNTKAYNEFAKLANSELGAVYVRHDGVSGEELVFENSDYRNGARELKQISSSSGFLLLETGDSLLLETGDKLIITEVTDADYSCLHTAQNIEYGKNIVNRFAAQAYPKRVDETNIKIYQTETPIYLASGESKTFRAFWRDPVGKRPINAIPPTGTSSIVSLLHFDEQLAQQLPDETGKVWNLVGDVYLWKTDGAPKFGQYAAYFDGSGPTSLESPHSEDWEFGNGDFTVEWWEYRFFTTATQAVLSRDGTDATPAFILGRSNGTNLVADISSNGSTFDIANGKSMGSITTSTWTHFAISREGNTFRTFKNGTLVSTWSSSATIFATTSSLYMGRNNATYLGAFIDELRIAKGEALYTASFTAPTAPFTLAGSVFSMWSNNDGTGTELTSSLVSSAVYGTEGATYTVENASATGGYLTINTYGLGIYSDSSLETTVEDSASIVIHGNKNVSLNQAYQQETSIGMIEAKRIIDLHGDPRTVLNWVEFCANKSDFLMQSFLTCDVGDLVHITITDEGIDSWYYIQGMEFRLEGYGVIFFKWIVKQAFTIGLGLSLVACEFSEAGTDEINFGPNIQVINKTNRATSAWIYLDTDASVYVGYNQEHIIGTFSDFSGYGLGITNGRKLQYYQKGTAGPGIWETGTNTIPLTTWTHILVYRDSDLSVTEAPEIYIDGALVGITETNTQNGAVQDESGTSIQIGNIKTATIDYGRPFDGKIKDARIYDMDKTTTPAAALAAALYAEGAGGTGNFEGVVFQAFAVRTEDLTAFTDLTLTTEKLLDAYNGYIGTPNGSPIVRIP